MVEAWGSLCWLALPSFVNSCFQDLPPTFSRLTIWPHMREPPEMSSRFLGRGDPKFTTMNRDNETYSSPIGYQTSPTGGSFSLRTDGWMKRRLGIRVGLVCMRPAGDNDGWHRVSGFLGAPCLFIPPWLNSLSFFLCYLSEPVSRPAAAWGEWDP